MLAALLFLQQTATSPVDAVLDHVRSALSIQTNAPQTQEKLLTGKATSRGVPCTYTMRYENDGHFVQRMDGTLLAAYGFDGNKAWHMDPSGVPQITNGDDREHDLVIASLLSDHWLRPGALSHAYLLGTDSDPKLLIQEWGTRMLETVTIDPQTWLPKEASFETHDGPTDIQFSDWKQAGQELVPFTTHINDNGDNVVLNVESATAPDQAANAYSIPTALPNDYSYNASIAPEVECKSIKGHLFVHPLVDGKDAGWFILDSCAEVMMIDTKTADSLGLEKVGASAITGIGGTILEPYRRAKEFQWGPARVDNIVFSELDAGFLTQAFGLPVAGIVGGDVFKRFVVEIDVEKPRVALYNSSTYKLNNGAWQPITFFGGNPAVQGTFEGNRQGYFELDTGADAGIMVNTPFVKGWHLLDGQKLTDSGNSGFGGGASAYAGEVDWLTYGGHRFTKVTASFSMADYGALANPDVIGVLGESMMTPFNMVFDFGHYRIALVPKA